VSHIYRDTAFFRLHSTKAQRGVGQAVCVVIVSHLPQASSVIDLGSGARSWMDEMAQRRRG